MPLKKKEEKEIAEDAKLKDRIAQPINEQLLLTQNVENPVEQLRFKKYKKKNKTNFYLSVCVLVLIGLSILLNAFFLNKIEPLVFEFFSSPQNFVIQQFSKPYVVTIGEFGNVAIAKDEAICLLPKLRQIEIKQLESGIYTFKMEQFGLKKNAYELANKLTQDGFEAVHVRYLPGQ